MCLPGFERFLAILAILYSLVVGVLSKNDFREELLIRPLPSGHIYSHAEFTTRWADDSITNSVEEYLDFEFQHYDLFPRALGEIVERYHVRELHLSLTQGLWRHRKWGYPVSSSPPGAQLWVWFNPTYDDLDQTWQDLVNALSGLICASLNFIDSTNTVSPELSYRPQGLAEEWYSSNSSYMRYAALPRENVCTENLTPWKKLLPCDTRSGLSTLLHPAPLYTAHYHSLSLHLRPACQDECETPHLELVQALSLVQDTTRNMEGHQDWSIKTLFSAPLLSSCPLADFTKVYVDVTENEEMRKFSLDPMPDSIEELGSDVGLRRLAIYDVRKALMEDLFNLKAHYHNSHIYGRIPSPPLHVSRFITGYGQEGGSITVKLSNQGNKSLSVVYLEVVPWYLRLYLHTSHAAHNSNSMYVSKLVTARDRERGWLYEAVVDIPAGSTIELSLEFSRALLKWLEYPPDANHGFYIPAATVSAILPSSRNISTNTLHTNTLKEKLTLTSGPSFVTIHTETLLVSLPTPDFSMPYNVICLACTVVALAFGPIHNITTKRLVLKKMENKQSPLSKLKNKLLRLLGKKPETDDTINAAAGKEGSAEDTQEKINEKTTTGEKTDEESKDISEAINGSPNCRKSYVNKEDNIETNHSEEVEHEEGDKSQEERENEEIEDDVLIRQRVNCQKDR